jgi:hypothetical protein
VGGGSPPVDPPDGLSESSSSLSLLFLTIVIVIFDDCLWLYFKRAVSQDAKRQD